jgi:hypothetical protein
LIDRRLATAPVEREIDRLRWFLRGVTALGMGVALWWVRH